MWKILTLVTALWSGIANAQLGAGSVSAAAPPVPFINPLSLSGLVLWLDAADGSTVTIATGVSQWNDKSVSANNATQATGANQPGYSLAARNGNNVLTFNGTTQNIGSFATPLPNGDKSVFAVFSPSTTVRMGLVGTRNVSGSDGGWFFSVNVTTAGNLSFVTAGVGVVSAAASITTGNWFSGTAIKNNTAGTVTLYQGVTNLGSTSLGPASSTTFNGVVGAEDDLFDAIWDGSISEIVIYNRVLNSTEIGEVQAYLQAKWNL